MGEQHTKEMLAELQSYPLDMKVKLTKQRIREWINEFGEDGVYVSFSGGKDSTVLLDIVRQDYPNVPAVFVDTGLEFPEIRQFVKGYDNVVWLKPKKNFRQVIQDYGYPFVSKEVSERAYYAQRYLRWYAEQKDNPSDEAKKEPTTYGLKDLLGLRGMDQQQADEILLDFINTSDKGTFKIKEFMGRRIGPDGKTYSSKYNYSRYKWLAICPYMISNKCCDVMKKAPIKKYAKESGRKPITGQMASESVLRTTHWLQSGCNSFDTKKQISNPMSFWTEQDVLMYVYVNKLPICSVYGDVVIEGEIEGQISLSDIEGMELFEKHRPTFKTTGQKRTGCMFCGFGTHLKKEADRFRSLKITHPKVYDYIMRPWDEGGLNYKEVIDWLNEHTESNRFHIYY